MFYGDISARPCVSGMITYSSLADDSLGLPPRFLEFIVVRVVRLTNVKLLMFGKVSQPSG